MKQSGTLCFHIAMSLIIMVGFIKGRIGRGFFLVLILHTILDFGVVMLAYLGVSIGLIEAYIGVFALLRLGYIVIRKKSLEAEIITIDEGEEAVREGY